MNVIRLRNLYFKVKINVLGASLKQFEPYLELFKNKTGLEIGGPSQIFQLKHYLPVYNYAKRIDGVNFSNKTVWEGNIQGGDTYRYTNTKKGHQYICEGNQLEIIDDNSYDFLLSSHNLEHFANPLKAISEWKRVLRPNGLILLVLPNKQFTFDRKRPITKMSHLLSDYKNQIKEDDLTHMEEILTLHDVSMDPPSRNKEYFKNRSLNNFDNRCLHHHVFDENLLKEIFISFQIQPIYTTSVSPYHIIALGRV
jgi:SAM-dependent methyltransferase